METIKVNMSPNPLDVQTIHASQNDTEARQWEFELHNNGELIDTSEVTEQMVFKSYKGGTEQLLPENTSTPTTSPFLGDIRYPQGLLTDQEFTYRQSPTEEDGFAKITDIKGNTLVWNQLIENGDFSTSSGWTGQFATVTISNNVASVRQDRVGDYVALRKSNLNGLTGHKYLVVADAKSAKKTAIAFYLSNAYSSAYDIQANTRTVFHAIITVSNANTGGFNIYTNRNVELAEGDVVEFYHVMLFDLTQMGLDITDPSEFTSLFPLSYYSYNQGSLLSFNGNGIKTVGKNRLNYDEWKTVETRNGTSVWENNGVTITATGNDAYTLYGESTFPVNARIPVSVGKIITLSWESDDNVNGDVYIFPNGTSSGFVQINNRVGKSLSYTPVDGVEYVTVRFGVTSSGNTIHFKNIMVRFADVQDSSYEPYTSSTLSLPISTYFPTGMKSAGSVYDELTESKAITRIGEITVNGSYNVYLSELTNCVRISLDHGRTDVKYPNPVQASNYLPFLVDFSQDSEHFYMNGASTIIFILKSKCGTTAESVKAYLNSNPLTIHYELATPTETSFTTASLVTENAEIPLSNNDGILIGKCTEELSENPGFIDAKIKLTDSDGTCYSNKLQLHIERSPQ